MEQIKKGDIVTLKPEWMDAGDETLTITAAEDEDGDRVLVRFDVGLSLNPTERIDTFMIATVNGKAR